MAEKKHIQLGEELPATEIKNINWLKRYIADIYLATLMGKIGSDRISPSIVMTKADHVKYLKSVHKTCDITKYATEEELLKAVGDVSITDRMCDTVKREQLEHLRQMTCYTLKRGGLLCACSLLFFLFGFFSSLLIL